MHAKTTHTTYDASVSKRTIIQASPISFEKETKFSLLQFYCGYKDFFKTTRLKNVTWVDFFIQLLVLEKKNVFAFGTNDPVSRLRVHGNFRHSKCSEIGDKKNQINQSFIQSQRTKHSLGVLDAQDVTLID